MPVAHNFAVEWSPLLRGRTGVLIQIHASFLGRQKCQCHGYWLAAGRQPVRLQYGRYGPYVQWGEESRSAGGMSLATFTLEQALELLAKPKAKRGRKTKKKKKKKS